MPTYEYRCVKCAVTIIEERTMSQTSDPDICLDCGERMIRLYNFGAVTFKGSGFYRTDK